MHQNTPNLNSNIYFEPPRLVGGALGGAKSRFDLRRGFFAPNQKIQKTKYVFIGPINTTAPLTSWNFEVDTLSPPSNIVYKTYIGGTILVVKLICASDIFNNGLSSKMALLLMSALLEFVFREDNTWNKII